MDKSTKRESEKNININKETNISTTTTSTSTDSPLLTHPSLPNDDDSITTSTESSDTFETWTLVMDKQKDDIEQRVEILKNSDDEEGGEQNVVQPDEEENAVPEDKKELQESLLDVTADDLSDGISIISESESNGRISPHPYSRDHLQDLNLKFISPPHDDSDIIFNFGNVTAVQPPMPVPVIVPSNEQQIRQRRRSSSTENQENKDKALQAGSQSLVELNNIPPIVKRGLQGIFYIGVALAILALIGRIRNPTWVTPTTPSSELEQKLNDMELQNNLMRAEIDLLNKQVKYLNTINDPQQQQKKSSKYKGQYEDNYETKEGKRFKAWVGNGDSLRPVEITKEDLKSPYKCPDGSFTEFAGMCVENRRNEPNIVEQFGQVVEDLKQQSETIQTFEKVAQELHGITENPFEQVQQMFSEDGSPQEPDVKMRKRFNDQPNEFFKNKPIYKTEDPQLQSEYKQNLGESEARYDQQRPAQSSSSSSDRKDHGKSKERYEDKQKFDAKPYDKDYKKSYNKDFNKDYNKKSFENQSKETFDKFKYQKHKHHDGDDDDDDDNSGDNSKERFNKHKNDSKERYQKRDANSMERYQKRDNNSKERHHKHNGDDSRERYAGKRSSSKERFNRQRQPNESGEWHENYMKHREDKRKENEEKYNGDNKNWYIKRGDDREHKRNGDIRYR